MWHLVFCKTMPLFQMWNHALCESLLWVTHLAFCEVLPSVRLCLLRDPGFCEALPSVRPWLLWDLAFCEALLFLRPCLHNVGPSVKPCFLWDLAFCGLGLSSTCDTLCSKKPCLCFRCENMPCVSPCCEWHTLLSVKLCPLWDLAFRETLASVRPCLLWDPGFCEALPSVRPFLLWDPGFVYFMIPCLLGDPAFV